VSELTLALANGATLVLEPREQMMPGEPLARVLIERAVTHLIVVPSALAELPDGDYPSLRVLCVAGEECPAALAERWSCRHRMVNLYGPPECTVWATYADLPAGAAGRHTIRRPGANIETTVISLRRSSL